MKSLFGSVHYQASGYMVLVFSYWLFVWVNAVSMIGSVRTRVSFTTRLKRLGPQFCAGRPWWLHALAQVKLSLVSAVVTFCCLSAHILRCLDNNVVRKLPGLQLRSESVGEWSRSVRRIRRFWTKREASLWMGAAISLPLLFIFPLLSFQVAIYKVLWQVFCGIWSVMLWWIRIPANSVTKIIFWAFVWDCSVDGLFRECCLCIFPLILFTVRGSSSTAKLWKGLVGGLLPVADIALLIDTVL